MIIIVAVAVPAVSFSKSNTQIETGPTGVIVPLYSYPGSDWSTVASVKEAYPAVPLIAIINPSNGPGSSQDPNFVSGITLLESAGVTVLGYVHTSYAARSIDSVIADVNSWKQMYHINGIFFDEMSNVSGYENYYSTLNSYSRSLGYTLTVGNPGSTVPASYLGTMDNILIYENSGLPSSSSLSNLGFQKSDFSFVSYDMSALNATFISSASQSAAYLYITNQGLPNPYNIIPPYFGTLVSILAQVNSLHVNLPILGSIILHVPKRTPLFRLSH